MKLTTLLLLITCLHIQAKTFSQKVSISGRNLPLEQIFDIVKKQTGFDILYNPDLLKKTKPVTVSVKNVELAKALDICFKDQPVGFLIRYNTIVVTSKTKENPVRITEVMQPERLEVLITGKVLAASGEALAGASIMVKGTSKGVTTDNNGNFRIEANPGDVLVVSMVGFIPWEMTVNSETSVQITLKQSASENEQVVVVGYGTQRKSDLTGAVGVMNVSKTMPNRPVTNVQELFAGAVPGLNVAKNSGAPGSGASLNIRGVSTIGGSSGVLVLIDGFPGNINTLNPNDIENVSVLKDAASAAIYGSRAANGVILITTKRGKRTGKPEVEINSNISIQQPQFQIDYVGSEDFMKLWDLALMNDGKPALYGSQGLEDLKAGLYSDNKWYREIYRKNSLLTNQSVAVSGSGEAITYRVAGSYDFQEGTLPNNDYKKFVIRPDLNIKVSEKISIDANVQYTQTYIDQPRGGTETWQVAAARAAPINPIYNRLGQFGSGSSFVNNPIAGVHQGGYNKSSYTELFTILGINYSPVKNWNIKGHFNRSSFAQRTTDRLSTYYLYDDNGAVVKTQNLIPSLTESYSSNWRNTLQVTSDYSYNLKDHNFKLLVGYSQEYYKTEGFSAFRDRLPFSSIDVLNTGDAGNQQTTGTATDFAIQSVFGRLNYDYDGRYLLQANFRADGSSRFSKGNRWGRFPSFSAGWNIHKEAFFNISWISQLKLRGSWGILGDAEKVGAYATAQVLTYNPQIYGLGGSIVPGAFNNIAIDPNITWELAKQTDIGIDISLFKNKLSISADYFYNKREDILTAPQVPAEFGLAGPIRNLFKLDNKGFEFLVGYRDRIGDFSWGADFNFGMSKNNVKYIGEGVEFMISGDTYTAVGSQLNLPYGLRAVGLFKDEEDVATVDHGANVFPGNIKYQDINKDNRIDGNDREVLNNKIPVRYGGNINIGWKNLDLSANFYGSMNNYRYINSYEGWAFFLSQNARPWAKDSWTPTNPNASYPRLTLQYTQNDTKYSSYWLRKASYLKLQNAQVGYTFPQPLIAKTGIKYLRAYLSAQNLFLLTDYPGFDPEGGYYPLSRTISFGVNLKF